MLYKQLNDLYFLARYFIIVRIFQPTADASISKDRALRYVTLKAGKNVATTPQRGFFGTIFNLIVEVRKHMLYDVMMVFLQMFLFTFLN